MVGNNLRVVRDGTFPEEAETDEDSAIDQDELSAGEFFQLIAHDDKSDLSADTPLPSRTDGRSAQNPYYLESVYFRSFPGKTLLTKAEELTLAKRIDQGTRRIKTSLKNAIAILTRHTHVAMIRDTIREITIIRRLSGLSAVSLDQAEALLSHVAGSDTERDALPHVKEW
jgi:RNA polymerase primary sigma factor